MATNESCNCKTTCSRRTTEKTRGCPCKTARVHCSDLCNCGSKKKACQNKPSAFIKEPAHALPTPALPTPVIERPSEDEERRKENKTVKEFIATLDEGLVRSLCVRALRRGVGSMEYVESLLIMEDSDDEIDHSGFPTNSGYNADMSENHPPSPKPPTAEPQPDWCKCGNCKPMNQEIENRCCGRKNCVSQSRRFNKLCLDPEVLELCIKNRADIRNDRESHSTSSFRKAAYRQFILEKYGYLGKGNRKIAPSCVVLKIRRKYPSPTGIYMGFRPE